MWMVAPLIGFAAQVSEHVGLQSLLTLAIGLGPLLVVVASFLDAKAYARVTGFDVLCGALSVVALVAWAVTGTGNLAILFTILADVFVAIPTLRKAYADPESEHAVAFLGGVVGAAITLLTIKPDQWGFASAGVSFYVLICSGALAVLALRPRFARLAAGQQRYGP
ncbi:MAG: hypothetical protein ACXVUX_22095, partial [Solirubrobacteraceae bacterium]